MESEQDKIKYVMMGEEGFYTFEDPLDKAGRVIGEMQAAGFVLIGVDGCKGFKVDPREVPNA